MKLMLWACLFFSHFAAHFALAFIPKPTTILSKATDNAGSGQYQVEQEVAFQTIGEPIIFKENWTIESSDKMKLIVSGTKELKDKLRWVFIYENGLRQQLVSGSRTTKKLDHDFIEKYFHIRKGAEFQKILTQTKAVPGTFFNRSGYKPSKEPDVFSDLHLRLARVGGVITYAFGKPTESVVDSPAAFFFEQDVFFLRKLRIGNMEVTADKFSPFARGLNFPRQRNVKWNENIVSIQTQQVTARAEKVNSSSLEPSTSGDFPELDSAKSLIEEFYKRFR